MPATSVTWYEAAKFVNWLNASGGSVPAYKFDGSGNFQLWAPSDVGYNSTNLYRNKLAKYFLPSVHEWHKAAYYDPSAGVYNTYPIGSNNVPDGIDFPGDPIFDAVFYDGGLNSDPNVITNVGLPSLYGTYGQAGNVADWIETAADWTNNATAKSRIIGGGSWVDGPTLLAAWNNPNNAPWDEQFWIGFRVATSVPEPCFSVMAVAGILGVFGLTPTMGRRSRYIWSDSAGQRSRACQTRAGHASTALITLPPLTVGRSSRPL